MNKFTVYLSGEIHSAWREELQAFVEKKSLPITLLSPECNHEASDDCGVSILGQEDRSFWKDHKAAKINAIRIRTFIERADIVVVRFGEKYRQWNAAFDAGYAAALGKPLVTIHPEEFTHALKELDAASYAVCETNEQAAQVLEYICSGNLPK